MFKYLTTPLKFYIPNMPSNVIDPTRGVLFMLKKSDLKLSKELKVGNKIPIQPRKHLETFSMRAI